MESIEVYTNVCYLTHTAWLVCVKQAINLNNMISNQYWAGGLFTHSKTNQLITVKEVAFNSHKLMIMYIIKLNFFK